jgi:hypothetical protein
MKTAPQRPAEVGSASPYEGLSADALLAILAEKDAFIAAHENQIQER